MLVNFNDNKIEFGKRLKHQRAIFSLSQEKLAEKIGCSTQYIYQIEAGKCRPSLDTLMSLAKYFGVSVDYLLFGNSDNINDILDSILKDFSPLQRESLANAITMIKYGQ